MIVLNGNNYDYVVAELAGKIVAKEDISKNGKNFIKITLQIDKKKFFLTAWRDEVKEQLANIEVNMFVAITAKIRNNNYETSNGKKKYDFDFEIRDVRLTSCKARANFSIVGRLTKDMLIKHSEELDDDFAIGSIAANTSSQNTTFINFRHKDFNENIGLYCQKGLRVKADGVIVRYLDNYGFFVNSIEACDIIKDNEE